MRARKAMLVGAFLSSLTVGVVVKLEVLGVLDERKDPPRSGRPFPTSVWGRVERIPIPASPMSDSSTGDVGHGDVLMVFWASWCAPCVLELRHIASRAADYDARGIRVIAVSLDESADAVLRTDLADAFPFPVFWDRHRFLAHAVGVERIPTSLLLRGGVIVEASEGLSPLVTPEAAERALESASATWLRDVDP